MKKFPRGQTYTSRMHPSIIEEFGFTADISNYLLMTEQKAQTNWHQDFTEVVFYFTFVEGKEVIFHRRANRENATTF